MDYRERDNGGGTAVSKFQNDNTSYFEVNRTPPDEKRRAEKAALMAASQEVSYLLLTPFTTIPRISFDKIKLGSSAVRQLVIRNPGEKPLDVSLEKLPVEEKGFEVDYVNFRLGGREETNLLVGWTPLKGGAVRDSFIVKFGGFRSQVILIGTCVAPEEKKSTRAPPRSVKPLGPKNSQKLVKGRPTFPASKLNTAPKISIPPNPVVRKSVSPPKRMFGGGIGGSHEILESYSDLTNPRRETFVRERPAPAMNDVLESTPINPGKTQKFTRAQEDPEVMGPPCIIPLERRQNFVPENKENSAPVLRRETFKPEDLENRFGMPLRRETYVFTQTESWTPQKLHTNPERKKWEAEPIGNLSGLQRLDESAEESVFTKTNTVCEETKNDSLIDINKYCLSPPGKEDEEENETDHAPEKVQPASIPSIVLSKPEEPLNLSVKKVPQIYQPDVSDISLADFSLNITENEMSMAMNMSEFCPERLGELDPELEDIEDRELEAEIDRLAEARAASGCRDEMLDHEQSPAQVVGSRLSSGTMIKVAPSLHASFLPDITDMEISLAIPELDVIETSITHHEERMITEKEYIREEVIEEVIEYEYEVVDNQRVCVGERNLGRTVTVQEEERFVNTPTKETRTTKIKTVTTAEKLDEPCDISRLIENRLCAASPRNVPRGVHLTESELTGMLGMLALSKTLEKPEPIHPNQAENMSAESYSKMDLLSENYTGLPGLKGSPRISNQQYPSCQSFLQKTIHETSFLPPSPDDPRRCSTGVKKKESFESFEVSCDIKKSLFNDKTEEKEEKLGEGDEFEPVPLSSGGHELPVIPDHEPGSPNSRLSSETYIASQDSKPLSIIQELDEMTVTTRETNSTFMAKEESLVRLNKPEEISKPNPSPEPRIEKLTTISSRTPIRRRRSNVEYIKKPIEQIATEKPEKLMQASSSGFMFVSVSPGTQEKRKSIENKKQDKHDLKRPRMSGAGLISRPPARVVASKNPVQPRPINAAKARMSLQKPMGLNKSSGGGRRSLQSVPKLTLSKPTKPVVKHRPNPYASRNRYYDERWVEKQEKGFSNWLNFILTPQGLEDEGSISIGKVDVAKLWSQCSQDVKVPRAPTREVMSMRAYTANREMNRLRRSACRLWQSKPVASVISKLEVEVERMRLAIRKDKNINKDVGMKQEILYLILSYNPLWLRVGLETIYGELLQLQGNNDLVGLSRFLVTRLLSCPDILAEFAHPTVPHSYREGHQEALNKFTLKQFLELVFFLDVAKENKLIQHNPCLFCPDSKIKSSRDILLSFSRDYLSGEGDIIKHLAYLKYQVTHKQTALDEFDYAVTNISTDLRCGLRLSKVAEFLTGATVSTQLRVPAVSMLQKVHNTEVALKELRRASSSIPTNISSKDVVNGHREKTLTLLWSIIFGFQLSAILDADKLREEILHLRRSLRVRVRLGDAAAIKGMNFLTELASRSPGVESESAVDGADVALLKEWAQLVTAHYNVEVENWTVSWCDGRGLCFLLYHYQPGLITLQDIFQETTTTSLAGSAALDDSLDFCYGQKGVDKEQHAALLENEKKNFKLLLSKVSELGGVPVLINPGDMSNTIPDEKVTLTFIGYLAARLLDISREIKAARVIQLAWRKYYAVRREEKMKVESAAAKLIQKEVRRYLKIRRVERFLAAAIKIQTAFRGYRARRELLKLRVEKRRGELERAALVLQRYWRIRSCRIQLKFRKQSLIKIQSVIRCFIARRRYLKTRSAVIMIQRRYRVRHVGQSYRKEFLAMKSATVRIQAVWRGYIIRREAEKMRVAATKIQSVLRCVIERRRFVTLKKTVVRIQTMYRAKIMCRSIRSSFIEQKRSCLKIQSWFRMRLNSRVYMEKRRSAILIQSVLRGYLCRRELRKQESAVRTIQTRWRAVRETRSAVARFQFTRSKIVTLQSWFRMMIQRTRYLSLRRSIIMVQACIRGNQVRREKEKKLSAVLKIQQYWRGSMETRKLVAGYQLIRYSAVVLQTWSRMVSHRRKYLAQKRSAVMIQSRFRGNQTRNLIQAQHLAASNIQTYWRSYKVSKQVALEYQRKRSAAVYIQAWIRMQVHRVSYQKVRHAAVLIQAHVRGVQVRNRLSLENSSVTKIQRYWRGMIETRRLVSDYQTQRYNAVLLQAWFRGVSQRNKFCKLKHSVLLIQSRLRGNLTRKLIKSQQLAALKIQTYWRSYKVSNQIAEEYQSKRKAALLIQSWIRMQVQRISYQKIRVSAVLIQAHTRGIQVRTRLRLEKSSTTTIQRYWRGYKESRIERRKFLEYKTSVIQIQSLVRGFIQRKRYNSIKKSVNLIQAYYKGKIVRETIKTENNSALVIQTYWRSYQLTKADRTRYLKLKSSAILIQSQFRMLQARTKYRTLRNLSIIVQKNIRRFIVVQRYKRLLAADRKRREDEIKSASLIQSWFRNLRLGRETRAEYNRQRNLIIFAQACLRMKKERSAFILKRDSAIKIQATFRKIRELKKYTAKKEAVLKIQTWLRSSLKAKETRTEYLITKSAAICIQANFRAWRAQREYQLKKRSAIKIQSCVRKVIAERQFRSLRLRTVQVQRMYRQRSLMRVDRSRFILHKKAAISIQAWWRMKLCRTSYLSILETIVFLQSQVRRYQAVSRFNKYRDSAVRIQRYYRSYLEMKAEQRRFHEIRESVLTIQRTWRGFICRQKYAQDIKNIVSVQNQVRGYLARRTIELLRQERTENLSALRIQTWFRRLLAVRQLNLRRQEKIQLDSAIIIQTRIRGFIARKLYLQKKNAALTIQSKWRAVLVGRKERSYFLLQRQSARTLQAQWRMIQCRRRYELMRRNIIFCQSRVRGNLERKRYLRKRQAVVSIQSFYRAWRLGQEARLSYNIARTSAIKIQAWSRMVSVRNQFLERKRAAVRLQSWFRGLSARLNYSKTKRSTIILQLRWRAVLAGRAERDQYLRVKNAAVLIQSVWRGHVCKWEFARQKESILILQKYTRGFLARRYTKRKRAALDTIQKTLRSYRAMKRERSEFILKRNSIVNLQRIGRGFLARQEFKKIREDAEYREQLKLEYERKEEERKQNSARVIVRIFRRFVIRKRFIKRECAVTVIQKYWRGYRSRVVLKEKWVELTKQLGVIRERLDKATATAEPKDRLGARTSSAIDFLFSIRDVAELICAVKTLDIATRLSEDCCKKLSHGENKPLAQLMNLINRMNRSVPHMEVVTISLDVLINIARVASCKDFVCSIPNLIPDLFQIMVVFRDSGGSIFSKICALLQILSKNSQTKAELIKPVNMRKLLDHQTRISTKQKLKEQNQKRRSFNPGAMPPPMQQRRPSASLNMSVNPNLTTKVEGKKRKGSSSLASGPPWYPEIRPRFHDDPNTAVSALIHVLELK